MSFSLRAIILIALSAAFTPPGASSARAQDGAPDNAKVRELGPLAYKIDPRLIAALNELHAGTTTEALAAQSVKGAHGRALARTANPDRLAIRIDAPVTAALLAKVTATGASILDSAPRWNSIAATATLSQIDALSALAEIRNVTLQGGRRKRQQGGVGNAADALMNADQARNLYQVTGAGQTVGVMSDSVFDTSSVSGSALTVTGKAPNLIVTGSVPQKNGDLPPSFQVVDPGPGGGSDEGEAMMELIYDVAPGASLAFASAGNTQTSAAANILALRTAANCNVIVDDIGFVDEPYFQDGPMAQAINTNSAAGVAHFSAYGNDGTNGIDQVYAPVDGSNSDDGANPPSGKNFHNWGVGTSAPGFLPIRLSHGDELTVVLEWNQPYSSFNLGIGSQADLDLYLYSTPAIGTPLSASRTPQGTTGSPKGDPVETLDYINRGAATTVYLAINHFQGVRNNVMRLVLSDSNGDFTFPSGGVSNTSAYGHPTTKTCIGIGAMNATDLQRGILAPESFSSQGGIGAAGIPYYFDNSGNPLPNAPVLVSGPTVAAPDNVDTEFFKQFQGTSCAAPNAAAVGALLLQAAPGTTPAQLRSALSASAHDATGAPATPGLDPFTGGGLIDAKALFAAVLKPPVITSPATATGNVGSFFNYTITATGQGTITYSATNLPPGLSFSGGVISGIPTTAGTFNTLSVTAANAVGPTSQTVTVNISQQLPVRILSQVGASPNPVPTGSAVTFTVNAVSDLQLPLSYSWKFGDTATGSGASPSHAYDNPGFAIATVTVSDGVNSVTSSVTVTVTPQPTFSSPPTASPTIAGVGQSVTFTAVASEGSVALHYTWDFGDGSSGSGSPATHTYPVAGVFIATVTAADAGGNSIHASVTVTVKAPTVGTGNDSDGDGFSDDFELAAGTDPNDPLSTPAGGAPAGMPTPLVAQRVAIKLNLAKSGADTISFNGTLPIPEGFSVNGQSIALDVSGVAAGFTLDAHGRSQRGQSNTFTLQIKSARGAVGAQTGKYTVRLNKGSFASTLAAAGLTTKPGTVGVNLLISLVFNNLVYQSPVHLTYTVAKSGKTATAK